MPLAANTDVDALAAFTACIAAIHLRLNADLIYMYELFFRNIFDFFKYVSASLGLVLCTMSSFFRVT